MSLRARPYLLATVAVAVGCRRPAAEHPVPAVVPQAAPAFAAPAYAPRAAGPVPRAPTDSILGDAPFAEVARARAIPPLRAVRLPAGTRELRIADWYPMIAGTPAPWLRVVEGPAGARGEVGFFWPERPSWPRRYRATSCAADPVASRGAAAAEPGRVCVYIAPTPPGVDWAHVAARLDSLGAWELSARCEIPEPSAGPGALGGAISDAGELLVQRLEGERFTRYSCNAPTYRGGSTAGRRAAALYAEFLALARRASPPPAA